MAVNLMSNRLEYIRPVDVAAIGFECKSVSMLNTKSGQHRNVVSNGNGATGRTFHFALRYLNRHRPPLAVLENVAAIAAKGQSDTSNLEEVVPALVFQVVSFLLKRAPFTAHRHMLDFAAHRQAPAKAARVYQVSGQIATACSLCAM